MSSENLHLERMSWPEVQEALDNGMTTAIIPCGAVEQHGPHLPLFMDAEHGTRLGEEVAEAGYPPDLSAAFADRILREGLRSITPNGILGDARGMSLQIGVSCIDAMADLMAEFSRREQSKLPAA